eukprot:TRINITY_DN13470_c0_g1_i1.p1 TRINITY_DN13470_c0_g1~~TRINITY_DN13470_c0_g1_i1.p1  ORF type:complete len:347 (-),score=47.08 TRINITY_DN13470_c0_g1_i1:114-1154(-)
MSEDKGVSYIHPIKLEGGRLTQHCVEKWRKEGAVLVDGLVEPHLLEDAVATMHEMHKEDEPPSEHDFGGIEYPSKHETLNRLTMSPALIAAARTVLGDDDILLLQSDAWAKWYHEPSGIAADNRDQRMHMDYGNNTLIHPSRWDRPECVAMIVYYSDTSRVGGGTAVVPRRDGGGVDDGSGYGDDDAYTVPYVRMPGQAGIPFVNDKSTAEAWFRDNDPEVARFREGLYAREMRVAATPGTVLIYRHDVWHRGTPLLPGRMRCVHNLAWKKASCRWISPWSNGWARKMYYGWVEKHVASLSPDQLTTLGFPPVSDEYWSDDLINALEARYGPFGLDVTPYKEGVRK